MNFSHRPRLRCVPISLRRMKSPSETMPTSLPAALVTGRPLTCRCSIMFAASTIVVSGVTVMTGRVMIWWARIGGLRGFDIKASMNRVLEPARRALTEVKGRGLRRLDAAQCDPPEKIVSFLRDAKPEAIITELSEQRAALGFRAADIDPAKG